MTVEDDGNDIKLHDQPMAELVLQFFKIEDCSPMVTPLPVALDLAANNGEVGKNSTPKKQRIEALLHLSSTVRPDICYPVSYLARFMHKPRAEQRSAGKHFLRYVKGTKSLVLKF